MSLALKGSAEVLASNIEQTDVRVHEQQSAVAEEINGNVATIYELGQGTAASVYQNGEISQKLIHEARRQQQLVSQFQRRG